jgi:hypothetical protein
MDEDDEVLELRERQLRNVPEELGWWYRVDSKTVGRYCNRCACWLPREEWDLCNWKAPADTEVERYSEVLGIIVRNGTVRCWVFDRWIQDLRTGTQEPTDHSISMENFCRDTSSTQTVERSRKSMCG